MQIIQLDWNLLVLDNTIRPNIIYIQQFNENKHYWAIFRPNAWA